PRPRQDAAEHEERVRLGLRFLVRNDRREDERVDEEQQQRVDERPEKSENRPAIAGLQLARDEARNEPAVAQQVGEVGKQNDRPATRLRQGYGGSAAATREGGKAVPYDRILARVATRRPISDFRSAMRARSASISICMLPSRSS